MDSVENLANAVSDLYKLHDRKHKKRKQIKDSELVFSSGNTTFLRLNR